MRTDYSGWIITIPHMGEKDLFPSFSDGCDVRASVAKFNQLYLRAIESDFPGAWVESGLGLDIQYPDDVPQLAVLLVAAGLNTMRVRLKYDGEWYVLV